MTNTTEKTYEIAGVSKDGNTYSIRRSTAGEYTRECDGGPGCKNGVW